VYLIFRVPENQRSVKGVGLRIGKSKMEIGKWKNRRGRKLKVKSTLKGKAATLAIAMQSNTTYHGVL
jgi:ribosomal protein L5